MKKSLLCLLALGLLACSATDQGKEAQAWLDKGLAQFQKQERPGHRELQKGG